MTDIELTVSEPIRKIDISDISATLNVTANRHDKESYTVDENLKDLLNIDVSGGVLKISSNKQNNKLGYDNKIVFNIGTDILEEIHIYDDVVVNGEGTFISDAFTIGISKGLTTINKYLTRFI